jgi:predicted RNA-binding protein associated with RNAse of E/G family
MPRIIHYSYTRPGKDTAVYDHWLVVDRPELKVLLMEAYAGDPLVIDGKVVAEPGAALLWFVFPGAWHDIGRFHLADDTFTGWYTNLCTPVEIRENTWASTDLFLDLWMTPDGFQSWLDEDELADAVREELLDDSTQSQIAGERSRIQTHLDLGAWPPPIAVELDLQAARGLLEE